MICAPVHKRNHRTGGDVVTYDGNTNFAHLRESKLSTADKTPKKTPTSNNRLNERCVARAVDKRELNFVVLV